MLPSFPHVLAGDVCVAVMSLQVSAPFGMGTGQPHLLHPTRPGSVSASSPPQSWGSQWPYRLWEQWSLLAARTPIRAKNPNLCFPFGTPLPLSTCRNSHCVKHLMI